MIEYTTKSGKELKITIASLRDALNLKNSIEKALIEKNVDIANIDLDIGSLKEFVKTKGKGKFKIDFSLVTSLIQIIMIIDSEEEVFKAIFKCLERCLYDGIKITLDTFESLEARADYYEVIIICLKENLSPFIKTLFSKSSELLKGMENKPSTPKQKTPQA